MMKYLLSFCLWTGCFSQAIAFAQDTVVIKIPIGRQLIHENIDQEQAQALSIYQHGLDSATTDEEILLRQQVKDALTTKVDSIQYDIEATNYEHRIKYRYLYGLSQMLRLYVYESEHGLLDPSLAPQIISSFREMMKTDMDSQSIASCVTDIPYQVSEISLEGFTNNYGYRVAKSIVFRKFAKARPSEVLTALGGRYAEFLNEPFTDTIIAAIAKKYPQRIYDYATSVTRVGNEVRHNPDTLVQTIVNIGESKNAIRIMPFLDYLVNNTYTISQLEKIAGNEDDYYKLCVKTEIDMQHRKLEGESLLNMKGMQDNVKERALYYIRQVNDLHESPDAVRFASVNNFTAQQIYFLLVNGEEEIYTSSYVGLFKRMMERMKPPKGDELLLSVYFDHFKKFIKLAAAYNTLDPFLSTMATQNSSALMQEFVSGLQNTTDLEDAVDVADAFGSIKDSTLQLFLRHEVDKNYLQMRRENNQRGTVIYALLASLFTSHGNTQKDSVWTQDISKRLNLPPIDHVPFKSLMSDSGRVFEEVFFYGDKDGFESYNSFMTSFHAPDWHVNRSQYWIAINSAKGKPVTIFVKLPFMDPDEDEKAMDELGAYLDKNNIHPSVYIHRGHSYHVNATIAQLQNSARIVMLGSCGGYNSLAKVLDVSPEAQIISSKQTGSMYVNEPIIRVIEETIRNGKNVNWENIWDKLSDIFKGDAHEKELFEDYIPPNKNLGAIFIKAYKQLMKNNGRREEGN